jgi:hypothetical protein
MGVLCRLRFFENETMFFLSQITLAFGCVCAKTLDGGGGKEGQGQTRRGEAKEGTNQPQGPAHGGVSQSGATRASRKATRRRAKGPQKGMGEGGRHGERPRGGADRETPENKNCARV